MDRAVSLLCVAAALAVVGLAIGLLTADPSGWQANSRFGGSNDVFDDGEVRAIGYASAVFTTAVSVGLWLWMAWANGRGKSWARTVATVLACLYGGSTAVGVVMLAIVPDLLEQSWSARIPGYALSLTTLLVGGYALWLLYRPESSAFYTASSPPSPGWPTTYPPPYPPPYPPYPPPYPPSYEPPRQPPAPPGSAAH
jgi:hypothetical protein